MIIIRGKVQKGVGDFKKRMEKYPEEFRKATGEYLFPGTLNVKIDRKITIDWKFKIDGADIGEPEQDLLFEPCKANGIDSHRIRPFNIKNGSGGHGDDVIEIASAEKIPNAELGSEVEIMFFRTDLSTEETSRTTPDVT